VIVILSTHIVDDVADLCPKFAVISKGRVLMAGEPRQSVELLRGKIWRRVVERDALASVQAAMPVISTRLQAGSTVVRAYAESAPGEGFAPVEPDLEDVYFSAVAGHFAPAEALAA
jgi:ABC-type multidrug transport system ATPase subunit